MILSRPYHQLRAVRSQVYAPELDLRQGDPAQLMKID
jgi:hypothetical protein